MQNLLYRIKLGTKILLFKFTIDTLKQSNIDILTNFGLQNNKTLLVLSQANENILLSSRNLKARVVLASELNTYDVQI